MSDSSRRAILLGGLGAGILDILYAIVVSRLLRGTSAVTVLQSVASGLLGQEAYEGGSAAAALGLFLHFVIAFSAAAVYVLASRRLPTLVRRPWLWGSLYGMAVYLFMNFVVLPLSAFPHKLSFPPLVLARGLAGHVVCVGLPIALAAASTLRRREP